MTETADAKLHQLEGIQPPDQTAIDRARDESRRFGKALSHYKAAATPTLTPAKLLASARFAHAGGRWWAEYGVRAQTEVKRVAETLLKPA